MCPENRDRGKLKPKLRSLGAARDGSNCCQKLAGHFTGEMSSVIPGRTTSSGGDCLPDIDEKIYIDFSVSGAAVIATAAPGPSRYDVWQFTGEVVCEFF